MPRSISASSGCADLHRSDSPVLLVLAGRDRLSWEDADPEYRDPRFLEQHLVGGLSERDSRLFLQNCGITDPSLQQAVLRVSVDTETAVTGGDVGYHPFSLGLCADTLRNEPGADPSSFDMAPGDVTRLADRFLKSLAGAGLRNLGSTPGADAALRRNGRSCRLFREPRRKSGRRLAVFGWF